MSQLIVQAPPLVGSSCNRGSRRWHLWLSLLVGCVVLTGAPGSSQAAADEWQDVGRIVVVGDAHGDYDNFVAVLRQAGIINRRTNWNAGTTHLVQLGDVPDRGPDTHKIIQLLQKLERQAQRAGGHVHVLIGNHEAMNMFGDLRYVDPGEYSALRTRDSRRLRAEVYARDVERRKAEDPEFVADAAFRAEWEQQVPLGMIEHRLAWRPGGEIGSWVLGHNAVIKINRSLFLHGGISPDVLGQGIASINAQIRAELETGVDVETALAISESGPLWYRGLAVGPEELESEHVDRILAFYDVDRIVIGHTPVVGTILPRFGGKVLVADVGLSAFYGGHQASLLLEGDRALTLQRGEPVPLPETEAEVLPYLQAVAALEPDLSELQELIHDLQIE